LGIRFSIKTKSGIRIKILEGLAMQKAVVSTCIEAEGQELAHTDH